MHHIIVQGVQDKIYEFSANQILREIDFGEVKNVKNFLFWILEPSEFDFDIICLNS